MEKEDIIGLTQQLYGGYFLQNLVKEYQLNGIDLMINHLAELRKMDKKVFSGEVKDYGNGIPKTWDDENF